MMLLRRYSQTGSGSSLMEQPAFYESVAAMASVCTHHRHGDEVNRDAAKKPAADLSADASDSSKACSHFK